MAFSWYQKNGEDICRGSGAGVKLMKIGEYLTQELATHKPLRIPLFQRRYCWSPKDFQPFYDDVQKQIGAKHPHRFNRLIVSHQGDHVMVIDGQQRSTTFCLLLSAIREVYCRPQNEEETIHPKNMELKAIINNILFPCGIPNINEIDFNSQFGPRNFRCVLSPTILDRNTFFQILHPDFEFNYNSIQEKTHVTQAYFYFIEQLTNSKQIHGNQFGYQMANSLLNNCNVLHFGVVDQDVWTVYERLAVHTATWEANSKGHDLADTDCIRNCILAGFSSEQKQLDAYITLWIPIEQMVASVNDITGTFDRLFQEFLVTLDVGYVLPNSKRKPKLFELFNEVRPMLKRKTEKQLEQFLLTLYSFAEEWCDRESAVVSNSSNSSSSIISTSSELGFLEE